MSIESSEPGSVFNLQRNQITEHRQKRKRTTYTLHQLNKLEELFNTTRYPNEILRQQLAETIEIDPYRVKIWFQNRRARLRNDLNLQNYHNKLQNWRMNNIEAQADLREEQEEQTNISVYLNNFYEPRNVEYPIYFAL